MRYLTVKQRVEIGIILLLIMALLYTISNDENKVGNAVLSQPNLLNIKTDYEVKNVNRYGDIQRMTVQKKPLIKVSNTEPIIIKETELSNYTEKELKLLYAIVWAEAGNQPYEGKVAVAETVINRVNSGIYPNTVKQVIYQRSQFNGVKRSNFGYYTDETVDAVHEAIKNPVFDKSVVYFANVSIAANRGFIKRVIEPNKVVKIGDHTFSSEPKLEKKGD